MRKAAPCSSPCPIEGHVNRCLRCGMTVSEHNPAAAAAPQSLPPARCAVLTLTAQFATDVR